jgi:hypothetical protein
MPHSAGERCPPSLRQSRHARPGHDPSFAAEGRHSHAACRRTGLPLEGARVLAARPLRSRGRPARPPRHPSPSPAHSATPMVEAVVTSQERLNAAHGDHRRTPAIDRHSRPHHSGRGGLSQRLSAAAFTRSPPLAIPAATQAACQRRPSDRGAQPAHDRRACRGPAQRLRVAPPRESKGADAVPGIPDGHEGDHRRAVASISKQRCRPPVARTFILAFQVAHQRPPCRLCIPTAWSVMALQFANLNPKDRPTPRVRDRRHACESTR